MSQSAFHLTYTLKAQSPMIHFQAQQQGATLRATEVKPKLDKFIIQKLGIENIPQDWFIPNTKAFNYKLRFRAAINKTPQKPHSIYYGDMGQKDPSKLVGAIQENCSIQILCFIPKLRETIDQLIGEFFICTNFGRMQGKGFGSFTIAGQTYKEDKIGKMLCDSAGAKVCYTFKVTPGVDPFDDIKCVYSVMKSGFNRTNHNNPKPEQYHRSYLFEYFHDEDIGNEKAAMKIHQISPVIKHPDSKREAAQQNFETYHYVRALLGIGDHIEYITAFEYRPDKKGNFGNFPVKDKATVLISSETVKRFASPIFFKIIDNNVYIVAKRVNREILGKEFLFTDKATGHSIKLSVPEKFDIDDFLDWFVDCYNYDTYNLRSNSHSYNIGKDITVAYEQHGGDTNG